MRIRHYRAPKAGHGRRAQRVSQRMWGDILAQSFGDTALTGMALEPGTPLPQADEQELLEALGGSALEAIQPPDFGPGMTGDEMLAWIEASFAGRPH